MTANRVAGFGSAIAAMSLLITIMALPYRPDTFAALTFGFVLNALCAMANLGANR